VKWARSFEYSAQKQRKIIGHLFDIVFTKKSIKRRPFYYASGISFAGISFGGKGCRELHFIKSPGLVMDDRSYVIYPKSGRKYPAG
jgi:hypothetical protein